MPGHDLKWLLESVERCRALGDAAVRSSLTEGTRVVSRASRDDRAALRIETMPGSAGSSPRAPGMSGAPRFQNVE